MNLIRNMKIGARLALGFGIVVALLALIAAVASVRIGGINHANDVIVKELYVKVDLAATLRGSVNTQARQLRNAIIAAFLKNGDEVKASLAKVDEAVAPNSQMMDKLKSMIASPKGEELFKAMADAREPYAVARNEAMKLVRDGNAEEASKIMFSRLRDTQARFFDAIAAMVEFQEKLMLQEAEEAAASGRNAVTITVALAVLAALFSVVFGVYVTRSITGPMSEALRVAQAVAGGDLTTRVQTDSHDEVGELLGALGGMNESLARIVGTVRTSSDSIATGSAQIATGNTDLSSRTEEQASSLQQTAASMEQLGTTVKQNADNARQANQLAQGASAVATKGGDVVGQVVQTMKGINESSKKIADIITVIDGIAFQTNILALNAAVEAARAGEQGRGFAVVAGEVRSLAQRSAEAAKEIKTLITASVERVEQGTTLADQAGETMQEIVTSIKRVTDIMGEISSASVEQSQGVSQVGDAVSQMDQVTQQNAALVEESAAAAESLKNQARQLVDAVAVFKLDRSDAAAVPHAPATRPMAAAQPKAAAVHAKPAPAAPKSRAAAPRPQARHEPKPKSEPAAAATVAAADESWETF